jgi:hypothetical protein
VLTTCCYLQQSGALSPGAAAMDGGQSVQTSSSSDPMDFKGAMGNLSLSLT